MSSPQVFCHTCDTQRPGRRPSPDADLLCGVCGSEFVEEQAAPAPRAAAPVISSWSWAMPGAATQQAPGANQQPQARAQVMIIQETIPFDLLPFGRGEGGAVGLNLGDYASSEQLEQIMGQLMQAYAPRRRPTARAFIEKLPRLPVAPAQPAGAGAGKSSTSGPAGQPQAPQSEQLLSQGQQPSTGAQASAAAASAAAAAPAASGDDAARYACCAAGDACPVCHEAYAALEQVVELPCQHCYHESCILPWLAEHNDCPVCRRKFESEADDTPFGTSFTDGTSAEARTSRPGRADGTSQPQSRLFGFLDRQRTSPAAGGPAAAGTGGEAAARAGTGEEEERRRRRQVQRLQAQHAQLRHQHSALQAQMQELQQASRQQLAQLLQQQQQQEGEAQPGSGVPEPSTALGSTLGLGDPAATPLADLAAQLREAQRAVDVAARHLRVFESHMSRMGLTTTNNAQAPAAPGPTSLDPAAAAAAPGGGIFAAVQQAEERRQRDEAARRPRERRRNAAWQQLEAEQEAQPAARTLDQQQQQQQQQARRAPATTGRRSLTTSSSSSSSGGTGATPRTLRRAAAPYAPTVVAVDTVLGMPSFLASASRQTDASPAPGSTTATATGSLVAPAAGSATIEALILPMPYPLPMQVFMAPLTADEEQLLRNRAAAADAASLSEAAAAAAASDGVASPAQPQAATNRTAPAAGATAEPHGPSAAAGPVLSSPACAGSSPPLRECAAAGAEPAPGATRTGAAAEQPQQRQQQQQQQQQEAESRQGRSWTGSLVAGALTLPWRVVGGMLGRRSQR